MENATLSTVENLQAARGRSRPEDSNGKLQDFRSYRIWGDPGEDSPGEMLVISEVSKRHLTLPMRSKPGRFADGAGKAGRLTYHAEATRDAVRDFRIKNLPRVFGNFCS